MIEALPDAGSLLGAHAEVTAALIGARQIPATWPGTDVRDLTLGGAPRPLLLNGAPIWLKEHTLSVQRAGDPPDAERRVSAGVEALPEGEITLRLRPDFGGPPVAAVRRSVRAGDVLSVLPPEGHLSSEPGTWLQARLSEPDRPLRLERRQTLPAAAAGCRGVDIAAVDLDPSAPYELLMTCSDAPPRWLIADDEGFLRARSGALERLFVVDNWSTPPRVELWSLEGGAPELLGLLEVGQLRRPRPHDSPRYDRRLDSLLLPVLGGVDVVRATPSGPLLSFQAYTTASAEVLAVLPGDEDELFVLERRAGQDALVRVDLRGGARRVWALGPAAGDDLVWLER